MHAQIDHLQNLIVLACGMQESASLKDFEAIGAKWAPYRSLGSFYMWKVRSPPQGEGRSLWAQHGFLPKCNIPEYQPRCMLGGGLALQCQESPVA
jgi:hypothetical protein